MTAVAGPAIVGANMITAPAANFFVLTPSNSANAQAPFRAIYVGVTGDITIVPLDGGTAGTFVGVPQGTILPVQGIRVNSTSTTASSLMGLV